MPIQNIPVTNANAQQYTNDPRLLSEVEQLRATVTNLEQKLASHQLIPPKAPARTSLLQCSKPRDFGIYYLIHYFATKLNKDKQTEPKDFSTCQQLSKHPPWDMLNIALQAVPNIFQPAELYRKADRDFIYKGTLDFASAYPINNLDVRQHPAQAIYNGAFETRNRKYIQFVEDRELSFIVALQNTLSAVAFLDTNNDNYRLMKYPDDPITACDIRTRRICALLCYMGHHWSALVKIRHIIYETCPGADTQFSYNLSSNTPSRIKHLLKNTIAVIFGPPRDSFIPHQLLHKSRSASRASARSYRSRKPSKLPPRRNTQTTSQNRTNKSKTQHPALPNDSYILTLRCAQ